MLATSSYSTGSRVGGRYRIEDLLGQGGMGCVYRAFDETRQTPVALKLPLLNGNGNARNDALVHEADVLSALDHPGVPRLFDHGVTQEGLAFLVMELIDGIKLSELLTPLSHVENSRAQVEPGTASPFAEREQDFNPAIVEGHHSNNQPWAEQSGPAVFSQALEEHRSDNDTARHRSAFHQTGLRCPPTFLTRLEWLKEVASILAHIHRKGFVYADLKPDNIIVRVLAADHWHVAPRPGTASSTRRLSLTLIDYGTCRAVNQSVDERGRGTIDYMSPEQHLQHPLDQRSDVFSFGVLAYELLTGVRPFVANEADRNAQRARLGNLIATEDHLPARQRSPLIWADVSALIDVCLEKLPSDRYQSMHEVLEGLEHADGSSIFQHVMRNLLRIATSLIPPRRL